MPRIKEAELASTGDSTVQKLNRQQQQAVEHTTGPLLVIAGAGTGKTSVLTHRIAWLIQQGHAKPDEILALTFTDKAAGEMEARVDQLVPYGYTDTTIATFHSFGNQLLRDYALDIGLPPEFRVLGQDEQQLFLSQHFDSIEGLQELRPTNNPRKFVSAILQVISRAKDELVTPEQYAIQADKLRKTAISDEDITEAKRQQDIATIYAAYENFKAERGVIDFGDQILLLVQLLDTHSSIKHRLQSQYKYVLVDEFQDTNVAQYELVKRLLHADNNLTVVGDDDQAIYKFRGAAVSNILGFLQDFPKATSIVLTKNYRSTQKILDAAYNLIQHNNPDRLESKLDINKQLSGKTEGNNVEFSWYKHEADEIDGLAHRLQQLANTTPLSSIAVLARSNNIISQIASVLRRAELPYTTSRDQGFTRRPEIQGIIAFLTALAHTDNSLAYMKLAFSPYYRLPADVILPINDAARRANRCIHDVLHDEQSVAWQRIPKDKQPLVTALRDDLDTYRKMIGSKNPGEILYQFLKDRGLLGSTTSHTEAQSSLFVTVPEQEQLEMVQNVAAVFQAIQGYIVSGRDPFTLHFVDELDELLSTVVPPTVYAGPDVDAINILTVHASKGLEFDFVFLPSLMSDRFPARRRTHPLQLPNELITEQLPEGDEHLGEERRLMYVAMTRAKQGLCLSGAERVGSGTRVKKVSPFVVESLKLTSVPTPIERLSTAARVHAFAPTAPIRPSIRYSSYNGMMYLSPAGIDTYLRDPYDFYWKYVLKAPQLPSRHLVYGNAIHSAIEAYYRLRKERFSEVEEERSDGISSEMGDVLSAQVLQRYSEAWRSEGFESQSDENRQFEHGHEVIRQFMKRNKNEPAPELIEYSFKLPLPGVRINGRMDAVFTSRGEIRDFKTSRVRDQKDADRKARENIPIRIYALAYTEKFGELPKAITLDFVEHDLRSSITPTDKLLEETRTLIAETAESIQRGEFTPNPNNPFADYNLVEC